MAGNPGGGRNGFYGLAGKTVKRRDANRQSNSPTPPDHAAWPRLEWTVAVAAEAERQKKAGDG
jgi:hypothetical protein